METRNILIIIAAVAALGILLYFATTRARAAAGGVGGTTTPGQLIYSTVLQQSLPGSVFPNARYYLPNSNQIVFQLQPGSTGDYAVLINSDGSITVLPDNTAITPNNDYSNITGYSTIPGLIAFGGGEEAPNPWSPCAAPCAPYVAFYTGKTINLVKLPGGSCDNMNASAIVRGNNNDIVVIGGANPGSATGSTGYVVFTPSLTASLYGTISMNDSAGNTLYLYRKPSITLNGKIYMIPRLNGEHTAAIEAISLQDLYTNGNNNANTLCGSFGNPITPQYLTNIGDFYPNGVNPIYTDGTNIYSVIYDTSGNTVLLTYYPSSNTYTRKTILNTNSNVYPAIANGNVYVAVQQTNQFTVYKFDLSGNLLGQKTYSGIGFVDMNGYIVQFTNGLNAGSKINVYTPL